MQTSPGRKISEHRFKEEPWRTTPRMCKDQTDVAAFGHKTQNTSPNEIHSDAQITVYCLYAFTQQLAGDWCQPQAFWAPCMCVCAPEQNKLPHLAAGLAAVGLHWPTSLGSPAPHYPSSGISSLCCAAILEGGVCLFPKPVCWGRWHVKAWDLRFLMVWCSGT